MRKIMRLGAHVASLALVVTGTALAVTPTQAATHDPVGIDQGATWLAGQVSGGLVPGQFGGPDVGLSIDTALTLRTAGGHDATVTAIADAIEAQGGSYLNTDYTFNGHHYTGRVANATAKTMALFQTLNPARTTVQGTEVQSRLESLVATAAPVTGRIGDTSFQDGVADGQDYANSIGQSFAAFALTEAGSAKAADVVAYLLKQQCANGGFRLAFTPSRTATTQSCTDNPSPTPDSDVDTTALVLQQLNQIPATSALTTAKTAARGYLLAAQKSDGSWGGGAGTEASNSNSTGLATVALGATTPTSPAVEKAAQWLRARQATYYDVCDRLLRSRGAVALNSDALTTGRGAGITTDNQDQWRRASAQAVPALAYLPVDAQPSAPVLTAPSGYFKQGSHPVLTTTGIKSGDQLCLNGIGAKAQGTATGTAWRQAVTLPAGTRTRSYAVRDAYGHVDATTVKVLGRRTLVVARTPGRVQRSRVITVAARGLAPHEPARIFYGSRLVRSGAASASGNLVARFSSGTSLGRKSIRAYGRFSDIRKGATTVSVVR